MNDNKQSSVYLCHCGIFVVALSSIQQQRNLPNPPALPCPRCGCPAGKAAGPRPGRGACCKGVPRAYHFPEN